MKSLSLINVLAWMSFPARKIENRYALIRKREKDMDEEAEDPRFVQGYTTCKWRGRLPTQTSAPPLVSDL